MDVGQTDRSKDLERLRQACKRSGFRLTHQRMLVFAAVAGTDEHPDVETIYRKVRKQIPTISLDTVYRTLWMLRDLGVIAAMGFPRDKVRFDGNTSKHHHFVCSKCGSVYDFHCPQLDELPVPREIEGVGKVQTTHLAVRGLCERCLNGGAMEHSRKRDAGGLLRDAE